MAVYTELTPLSRYMFISQGLQRKEKELSSVQRGTMFTFKTRK